MIDIKDGSITPRQLRELADMIEKGRADATYTVDVQVDNRHPIVDYVDGLRVESFEDKKLLIEVRTYGRCRVLLPNGTWILV